MAIRVGMVSLGCSKNQVDAERMLYKLNEKGYDLVGDLLFNALMDKYVEHLKEGR